MNIGARTAIILAQGMEEESIPTQFFDSNSESSLIEYVLNSVWTVADEIFLLFTHEPELELVESISPFGVKIIIEKTPKDMLSLMYLGVEACKSDFCFITIANAPFIKPNLIYSLFEAVRGYDAAIPRWSSGKIEPLFAVYRSKSFLKVFRNNDNMSKPEDIIEKILAIKYLNIENEIKEMDPDLHTFFRINDEDDLKKVRDIAEILKNKF